MNRQMLQSPEVVSGAEIRRTARETIRLPVALWVAL